jgi:hypothetical protein
MSNIYIVRTDIDGLVYRVTNLDNLSWSVDTPVSPMPLPEESHEENILVKMEGNSARMDISWTLTDADNFGTLSFNDTTKKYAFVGAGDLTIYQQINKFKDEFVPKSIGDGFKIVITEDDESESLLDFGTVSNMNFSVSGDSPVVWKVRLSFLVGTVVALFEADIPERPDKVIFTTTSTAGQLSFDWTKFSGYADAPPALVGYKIKLKRDNSPWEIIEFTEATASLPFNTNPILITGLNGGVYRASFGLTNANSADAARVYMVTVKNNGGGKEITVAQP